MICLLLCINHRRCKRAANRTDSDGVVEGVLFGEYLALVDSTLSLITSR